MKNITYGDLIIKNTDFLYFNPPDYGWAVGKVENIQENYIEVTWIQPDFDDKPFTVRYNPADPHKPIWWRQITIITEKEYLIHLLKI